MLKSQELRFGRIMSVFIRADTDMLQFLRSACRMGPKRIPLLQYDTEGTIEISINRRIMAGSYLKLIQNWLPGGYVWRKKVYCCHPFEIVINDISLSFNEIQKIKDDSDCPHLFSSQITAFERQSYLRGYWVNYYKKEIEHADQIGLYSSITGIGRKGAIHELSSKLKIKFSEKESYLFQKPHDSYPIKAFYGPCDPPEKFEQNGIDVKKTYCFHNANSSIRGWGYKVMLEGQAYFACLTPWRNKNDSSEFVWQPFGFEKPYPFYGVELLERFPEAAVILTEDIDLADSIKMMEPQQPLKWIILSWIGGKESVAGLDWQSLLGKEVHYLAINDAEGRSLALAAYEAAHRAGVTIQEFCWCSPNSEEGSLLKSIEYKKQPADDYIKDVRKECGHNASETKAVTDIDGKWLGEFLKENIDKMPFLLEPLIKTDELVIVAAPKKTSKSFLALDLAMALASGDGFGGRFSASEARRVTFVDAEMGEAMLQDRAQKIKSLYKSGNRLDTNLLLLSLGRMKKKLNLIHEKDREWLEAKMAPRTRLLVLDNLGKLIPPHIECKERDWRIIEGWIRELNRRGVGVILVTHMTKNGSVVRGTGKILDDANTVVTLKRPDKWTQADRNKVEFHYYGRDLNDEQLEPFGIQYKTRSDQFFRDIYALGESKEGDRLVSMDEIERYNLNSLQVEMLTRARKDGVVRAGNFKTESGKPSPSTISNYLRSLCQQSKLLRIEGKGNQARYYPVKAS